MLRGGMRSNKGMITGPAEGQCSLGVRWHRSSPWRVPEVGPAGAWGDRGSSRPVQSRVQLMRNSTSDTCSLAMHKGHVHTLPRIDLPNAVGKHVFERTD